VQAALIQKFPNLPIEIIVSVVDDAKNDYLIGRFSVFAAGFFYLDAMENIKLHQKKVQEVFTMLMLIRERNYSKTSSFGSYVTHLPSRPLEKIGDILEEAFTEDKSFTPLKI
jgi:hypothetical protein